MGQAAQIMLVFGEISKQKADVIVSTIGNDADLSTGSVSYALLEAGGDVIQEELTGLCPQGRVETGTLAQTNGGNLKCKRVFHLVLSQWTSVNDDSETVLLSLVTRCLQEAAKLKYESIAIPALGTGFHRFPGERSAEIIFTAVETYLKNNPVSPLKTVQIVVHPKETRLRQYFEARRDGRSVAHANFISKEVVMMKTFTQLAGSPEPCTLKVVIGNLAKLQADVLVNTTQVDLILSIGAVSFSLLEAGGMEIQIECSQKCPEGLGIGEMIQTSGGKLSCKKLFHVVLPQWNNGLNDSEKLFQRVFIKCLEEASKQNMTSIGFPVLGTGYVEFPPERAVQLMLTALARYLTEHPDSTLQTVFIVVHPKDEALREIVESQVQRGMDIINSVTRVVKVDGSELQLDARNHVVAGKIIQEEDLFTSALFVEGEREALKGTEVKIFKLTADNVKRMSPEEYHYRLVESQVYKRMLHDPENKFEVISVDYIVNPVLHRKFRAAQVAMKKKQPGYEVPVLAFHGTKDTNIESICQEGFRQPDHPEFQENTDVGWYGNGIYFSEYPSYSSHYVEGEQVLLLCQVLQGKVYKCSGQNLGAGKEPGFDSHMDPYGLEIVIYDQDCILPCYIVHYKQLPCFQLG